jgi:hypothetical protein
MLALKRSALFVIVLLVTLVGGLGLSARTITTQAQDDMDLVTCDSTLVTLLYIAEHDYGFHSMFDVSNLEKGQYAPLFEAMMAMMEEEDTMMEETSDEEMTESMTEESMMDDMITLTPGVVEDEDQFCADLRAELDTFFYKTLTQETMDE